MSEKSLDDKAKEYGIHKHPHSEYKLRSATNSLQETAAQDFKEGYSQGYLDAVEELKRLLRIEHLDNRGIDFALISVGERKGLIK